MDLFTNKFHWNKRKLLPKFVYTIYGLPMMIMPLRNLIKWNPAVKTANDQKRLETIDVGATDHAPYFEEKKQPRLLREVVSSTCCCGNV
jgi:dihydroorotase